MQLERASWTDADDIDTNLALIPVGSTEQHGPHAPLGTDILTAQTVSTTAEQRFDDEVVVTPPIPVGIAEEHRQFTGTLWTSESTLRAYVRDIVESLIYHGWNRIVLVNGHGGNISALKEISSHLTRHEDAYVVPFTWFNEVGDHSSRMGHGGPLETALLRYAKPESIKETRLKDAAANASNRWGEWQGRVNLAVDSLEFTENGVVGDPCEGTSDLGRELLDAAVAALIDLLDEIAERDLSLPDHK
jgi:creatinine amidohydrolase